MLYFLTENTNYTSVDFLCMSSGNTISSNTIYFFIFVIFLSSLIYHCALSQIHSTFHYL